MEIFTLLGLLDCQSLLYIEISIGEYVERCLTKYFTEKELEVSRDQNFDPERIMAVRKKSDLTRTENLIFPHH